MTLPIFFRRSLFSTTLRTAIFVAMNMPQGPFQPLHANGIRNGGFGAVRSMAAYMQSMFQQLGLSDPGTCRLSRNEAVMARQI